VSQPETGHLKSRRRDGSDLENSKQTRDLPYFSGLSGTQPVTGSHRGSLAINDVDDTTHCALDPVRLWPHCAVDGGRHVAIMGLGRSAEPRVGIGTLREEVPQDKV
jgi:hypothetical protein